MLVSCIVVCLQGGWGLRHFQLIVPASMHYKVWNSHHTVMATLLWSHDIGYFSTLNMEFEMRNENISVTIMPIPYVLTDRAVDSMKVKSNIWADMIGITSEVSSVVTQP